MTTTERSRPLVSYFRKISEFDNSQFLDLHTHPLLLYSQNPSLLDNLWSQFETVIIVPNNDPMESLPEESELHVGEISVVDVKKYSNSPPINNITIGRSPDSDIVFATTAISKLHAYIFESEDGYSYEIIDADSTNGTRVNDEELVPFQGQPLVNLDRVDFGRVIRAVYFTPRGFYEFLQQLSRFDII